MIRRLEARMSLKEIALLHDVDAVLRRELEAIRLSQGAAPSS